MIQVDPDRIAEAFFAGEDALSSLPAADLRMIHLERCQHCKGGPSTRIVGRFRRGQREWHEVCATCRRHWEPEPWGDRCVLRGEIQTTPRVGATEDSMIHRTQRLTTWRWARPLVEPRPSRWPEMRWRRTLLWWRAVLPPVHATYAAIARLEGLHPDTVAKRLHQARSIVERRALRPGHRAR